MITRGQWLRIMTRDNWTCHRPDEEGNVCARSLEEEGARPQVGHIVPESLGGKSVDSNLRAECGDCNESAGNGLPRVGNLMPDYSAISRDCERSGMEKVRQSAGVFFSLRESDQNFEAVYHEYPVHVGKNEAKREWRNAVVRFALEKQLTFGEAADLILDKVRLYAISDAGRHHGLWPGWRPPYLSKWLSVGHFTDDPEEWQSNENKQDDARGERAARVVRKFSFTPPKVRNLRSKDKG